MYSAYSSSSIVNWGKTYYIEGELKLRPVAYKAGVLTITPQKLTWFNRPGLNN